MMAKTSIRAKFGVEEDWEFGFGHIQFVVFIRHTVWDTELTVVYMGLEFEKAVQPGDKKLEA